MMHDVFPVLRNSSDVSESNRWSRCMRMVCAWLFSSLVVVAIGGCHSLGVCAPGEHCLLDFCEQQPGTTPGTLSVPASAIVGAGYTETQWSKLEQPCLFDASDEPGIIWEEHLEAAPTGHPLSPHPTAATLPVPPSNVIDSTRDGRQREPELSQPVRTDQAGRAGRGSTDLPAPKHEESSLQQALALEAQQSDAETVALAHAVQIAKAIEDQERAVDQAVYAQPVPEVAADVDRKQTREAASGGRAVEVFLHAGSLDRSESVVIEDPLGLAVYDDGPSVLVEGTIETTESAKLLAPSAAIRVSGKVISLDPPIHASFKPQASLTDVTPKIHPPVELP